MTALITATMPLTSQASEASARPLHASFDAIRSGLDADSQSLLSILVRTLYLLGLGTIGVVAITAKPPLSFVPLALLLFIGICLQWRQSGQAPARSERSQYEPVCASSVRHSPFVGYEDKA